MSLTNSLSGIDRLGIHSFIQKLFLEYLCDGLHAKQWECNSQPGRYGSGNQESYV